jgi:hypothetical protein
MPGKHRLQDQEDAELAKEVAFDGMKRRDEIVLELLREQGFCLATMPVLGAPAQVRLDFTYYLPQLDGCPNLVVSAPAWTREEVSKLFERLPHRQLPHGMRVRVTDAFDPAPGNWFRFETEIVYVAAVVADPPYEGGAERIPWAHCATLNIVGAGTESELRVIHVGLGPGRDSVFVNFLAPHALVPKRLLI